MKKLLICLLALALLIPAALADTMTVVNCEEWVSLREAPDTKSARLKKVPLYERVEDCESAENGFMRCTYDGVTGYILEKYLEPAESDEPEASGDGGAWTVGDGYSLSYRRDFDGDSERLTLICGSAQGEELWRRVASVNGIGQMNCTNAFPGGTREAPRAMIYSTAEGLMCLDIETGEALWTLTPDQVRLGAGQSACVGDDGRMYICGFDGPDPVCIDMDGNVLWTSSSGSDDIYWPYEITLTDEGVVTRYDMLRDSAGRVIYDYADGHVLRTETD